MLSERVSNREKFPAFSCIFWRCLFVVTLCCYNLCWHFVVCVFVFFKSVRPFMCLHICVCMLVWFCRVWIFMLTIFFCVWEREREKTESEKEIERERVREKERESERERKRKKKECFNIVCFWELGLPGCLHQPNRGVGGSKNIRRTPNSRHPRRETKLNMCHEKKFRPDTFPLH